MNLTLHKNTRLAIENFIFAPSHALGLIGTPGAGKDYLSRYIASQLLDIPAEQLNSYPYLKIIDAELGNGIEDVRELQAFLSLKVPGSRPVRRCVIIRFPELLRHEAQNALLKTLEEPPLGTIIICTIANSRSLLPTIVSRIQTIGVLPLSLEQAASSFKKYSEIEVGRAYYISEGNAGLLAALLEKKQEHPMVADIALAKEILQCPAYQRLIKVDSILKDKEQSIAGLIDALYKLLHAAIFLAAKNSKSEIQKLNGQIAIVLKAQTFLDAKVQPKILLSWLFYSL